MALQAKFRQFDEAIKLKRFDENAELREKRDRVLTRLRDGLAKQFPSTLNRPTFTSFNQGSYDMGTGVKPLNGDYDIDVGLVFNVDISKHGPIEVKEWVYNAVKDHTTDVRFRRPCITVFYVQGGEPKYHVDLAVYAKDWTGTLHLAMGKQHASADQRQWLTSEPQKLVELVASKFSGDDAEQFRRVIRYLKRWKDCQFPAEGTAAPTGIGITACALNWFAAEKSSTWNYNTYSNQTTYDDLVATTRLVERIRQNFVHTYANGQYSDRLKVTLPVPPGNDVFARMSNQQMVEFKQRIDTLFGTLVGAGKRDENEASVMLRKVFGDAFPA